MKTSTTLHECDICAQKRIDGALIPEGWSAVFGFELVCPLCAKSVGKHIDEMRGTCAGMTVQLASRPSTATPHGGER